MDLPRQRLPLMVIGGYLGAGKTTLVNRLLADPQGQRIAVLVNDFGEIGIDEGLLAAESLAAEQDQRSHVLSLANGCVCCSLADGFASALDRVRAMADRLDRVVVEVSGVGEPGKVAQWARTPGFRPDGVLVVVDGSRIREQLADPRIGQTVAGQVADAGLIVLTHGDLLDATDLTAVERSLAQLSAAPILRSPVDPALLFGLEPAPVTGDTDAHPAPAPAHAPAHAPAPAHAHANHVTWSLTLARPVPRATLELWQSVRPKGVVRAKGIVRLADAPDVRTIVQLVGDSTSITASGPWTGDEPGDSAGAVVAIAVPGTPRAALVKWLGMLTA
jgi:G3E family GTPase